MFCSSKVTAGTVTQHKSVTNTSSNGLCKCIIFVRMHSNLNSALVVKSRGTKLGLNNVYTMVFIGTTFHINRYNVQYLKSPIKLFINLHSFIKTAITSLYLMV